MVTRQTGTINAKAKTKTQTTATAPTTPAAQPKPILTQQKYNKIMSKMTIHQFNTDDYKEHVRRRSDLFAVAARLGQKYTIQ